MLAWRGQESSTEAELNVGSLGSHNIQDVYSLVRRLEQNIRCCDSLNYIQWGLADVDIVLKASARISKEFYLNSAINAIPWYIQDFLD